MGEKKERTKVQKTYFRFCKRCGEKYIPTGKYSRFCEECKKDSSNKVKGGEKK